MKTEQREEDEWWSGGLSSVLMAATKRAYLANRSLNVFHRESGRSGAESFRHPAL